MKTALITGATSGFGRAIAFRLAKLGGYKLIITGRRSERLDELSQHFQADFSTEVV